MVLSSDARQGGTADQLVKLAELQASGKIDDADFARPKAMVTDS